MRVTSFTRSLLLASCCLFLVSCSTGKKIKEFIGQIVPANTPWKFKKKWSVKTYENKSGYSIKSVLGAPIVNGDTVYQSNIVDGVSAYAIKTVKKLWHFDVKDGVSSGVIWYKGNLYFGGRDRFFYKIKAKDGTLVWKTKVDSSVLSLPSVSGLRLYFTSGNDKIYALDTRTGKQVWTYRESRNSVFSIQGAGRPLVSGKMVFAGFSNGYFIALSRQNGSLIWKKKLSRKQRLKDIDSYPSASGSYVYVNVYADKLYCLNKKTGQIVWSHSGGGNSSPLIEKNTIYYSSNTGLIALNKKTGKKKWSYKTEGSPTTPIKYKKYILFGISRGDLRLVDAKSGSLLAKASISSVGSELSLSLDPNKNTAHIYFIDLDFKLLALTLKKKSL